MMVINGAENGGENLKSSTKTKGVNGNGDHIEKRVRNSIALSTLDGSMEDAFESTLSNKYNLNLASIDDAILGGHDFYVIDLLDQDVIEVRKQIAILRENEPDSEVFLIASEDMMKDPLASRLRVGMEKYLIPRINRPEGEVVEQYNGVVRSAQKRISDFLNRPFLAKTGGSIWDLVETGEDVLQFFLKGAKELHNAGYPIVLTTGGGPRLDTERMLNEGTGASLDAEKILLQQALGINEILGDVGLVIGPKDFQRYYGSLRQKSYLRDNIPIVYSSGEDINPIRSDAHTLAIGEKVKAYKLIFAKDTKGLYDRDPNVYKPKGRVSKILSQSEENIFRSVMYADQVITDIDRKGRDGRGDHVVETDALIRLQHMYTKNVRAIQIIDGKFPDMLRYAMEGHRMLPGGKDYVGSFILRGEVPRG